MMTEGPKTVILRMRGIELAQIKPDDKMKSFVKHVGFRNVKR